MPAAVSNQAATLARFVKVVEQQLYPCYGALAAALSGIAAKWAFPHYISGHVLRSLMNVSLGILELSAF